MPDILADAFDLWTPAHLAGGFLLGYVVREPWHAFALIVGWELFELLIARPFDIQPISGPESLLNIASDIAIGYAGFEAQRRLVAPGLEEGA